MSARTDRDAAVARIARFTGNPEGVRKHLACILESHAFKGSRRSQEFFRYVVEKSLAGDFEALKERVLGVEIFGRAPTYDTSEDAIVRVTAIDVRKRLLRYYEFEGADSEFRIHLPSGSYVPEFSHASMEFSPDAHLSRPSRSGTTALAADSDTLRDRVRRMPVALWLILALVLGLLMGVAIGRRGTLHALKPMLPWSAMFQSGTETQLVFCDTSLDMLQEYLHTSISLSDYANRRFLPDLSSLSADAKHTARLLGGPDFATTTAPVDVKIATRISEIAQSYGHELKVRPARELNFRDFKTDGNFILLGSPRSNPWSGLFQDHLDFYFAFDPVLNGEVCLNAHRKAAELAVYEPTARGGGTGDAFAIAAFVGNPDQEGNVLILAGSNAEATEASARFMADIPLLTKVLRNYGVDSAGPLRHFEALLRVTTMAGSPNRYDVIALHLLDNAAKH